MAKRPAKKTKATASRGSGGLTSFAVPLTISAGAGVALLLAVAMLSGRLGHGAAAANPDTGLPQQPQASAQAVMTVRVDPALWKSGVSWRALVAHYGLERDLLAATLTLHRRPDGGCPSADDIVPINTEVDIALAPGHATPCEVTDLPATPVAATPKATPANAATPHPMPAP